VRSTLSTHLRAQPGHLHQPAAHITLRHQCSHSRQAPRPAIRASAGRRSSSAPRRSRTSRRSTVGNRPTEHAPGHQAPWPALTYTRRAAPSSSRPQTPRSDTDLQAQRPARTPKYVCNRTRRPASVSHHVLEYWRCRPPGPPGANHTSGRSPSPTHRSELLRSPPAPWRTSPQQRSAGAHLTPPSALLGHPHPPVGTRGQDTCITVGTRRCRRTAVGNRPCKHVRASPASSTAKQPPRRQPSPRSSNRAATRRPSASVHAHNRQSTEEQQPAPGSSARRQHLQCMQAVGNRPSTTGVQNRRQSTSTGPQAGNTSCARQHQKRAGAARPSRGLRPRTSSSGCQSPKAGGRFAPRAPSRHRTAQAPLPRRTTSCRGIQSMRALRAPVSQPGSHQAFVTGKAKAGQSRASHLHPDSASGTDDHNASRRRTARPHTVRARQQSKPQRCTAVRRQHGCARWAKTRRGLLVPLGASRTRISPVSLRVRYSGARPRCGGEAHLRRARSSVERNHGEGLQARSGRGNSGRAASSARRPGESAQLTGQHPGARSAVQQRRRARD
jgi:hypothetical protein